VTGVSRVEVPTPKPPEITEPSDRRGSPIPTPALISTRFTELRKRRGLMITLFLVTVGIPTLFLGVRLILHALAPQTYGPAGGYDIYAALTGGVLYTFGFIVAAALGCTAGSVDLSEGMFRHLVITGRSRVALYLARIPAGLAIIVPLVALGFSIVCAVCVFAAPSSLNVNGMTIPSGLSQSSLENWATDHAQEVLCDSRTTTSTSTCRAAAPPGPPDRVHSGRSGRLVATSQLQLRLRCRPRLAWSRSRTMPTTSTTSAFRPAP
jgi:hypothetical protein